MESLLAELITYYQQYGFFQGIPLHQAVAQALAYPWLDDSLDAPDIGVLRIDGERVLYLDFEGDGVGGDTNYQDVIPKLARISRGLFSPSDIQERALDKERDGRVELTIRVDDTAYEYEVRGGNTDWIDARVLWIMDEFLAGTPFRVHAAAVTVTPAQHAAFTVLSPEERTRIREDRGAIFVPLPAEPAQPWDWDLDALKASVDPP
jgi:hypothetical protein